ncbi:MAG TPA: ImmA/IrrE family metallo-endopeptidase, partial [Alphaproteobacteria bacterium]|nr:ImmA/IrrE family metallo-endopeptidase [Alphaproteobacteria bacterium]
MTIRIDWMPPGKIEAEATALLASYEQAQGKIDSWATPVEEIAEIHLGLACEIIDFGADGILGQIDIEDKIIKINSYLEPSALSGHEGRFYFTFAHEVAHWVLHRHYVERDTAPTLFDSGKEKIILCRQQDKKEPVEWQADTFASCLLMPAEKIFARFRQYMKSDKSRSIQELCDTYQRTRLIKIPRTEDEILGEIFGDMAEDFKVSRQALIIRLKGMGLLQKDQAFM